MATLMPEGKQSFTTATGAPMVGGKLYTYAARSSTPKATYSDAAGLVPNTNPVVLDARGEAIVFWAAGAYKVVLKDAADIPVWTMDDLMPSENAGSAADVLLQLASTAAEKNAALVAYSAAVAYAAGTAGAHMAIVRSAKDHPYLAPTDGSSANTALAAFFASASDGINFLPAGTYTTTALLDLSAVPLSRCVIRGVPGKTKITGNFGYALILLGALDHVVFEDIVFESAYVNATPSGNTAIVMTGSTDVIETGFERCKFTAPNAATQGLAFFTRTVASGTDTAVIDGLWIQHCEFEALGNTGCTIYNRQQSSDRYSAARRVHFDHNKGRDLGITAGAIYGMLLSLDGYGSDFTADHNHIKNALRIGIENTGWINGSISHNRGVDFSRKWRLVSLSDPVAPDTTSGITAIDNICDEPATTGSYISRCTDAFMAGNQWSYTGAVYGANAAFSFLDCTNVTSVGDRFSSDSAYALRLQAATGNCAGNRISEAVIDTSGSSSVTACINFDGASCLSNQVLGRITKGTGGVKMSQTNGAQSNVVGDDTYPNSGSYTPTLYHTTNVAASTAYACSWSRVNNMVTVTGRVDVDPTAAGAAATLLGISLPISSNLATSEQLGGVASPSNLSSDNSAALFADIVNGRAAMSWQCADAANHGMHFQFSYQVL